LQPTRIGMTCGFRLLQTGDAYRWLLRCFATSHSRSPKKK
jgi:hypothetical protein